MSAYHDGPHLDLAVLLAAESAELDRKVETCEKVLRRLRWKWAMADTDEERKELGRQVDWAEEAIDALMEGRDNLSMWSEYHLIQSQMTHDEDYP